MNKYALNYIYKHPPTGKHGVTMNQFQPIPFLEKAPEINGIIDSTKKLPPREFNYLFKMNPENPVTNMNYRLAYGTDFFYVFIEVDTDTIICRDRGYQNGDGFLLLLTVPRLGNESSNEFYLLGFYPTTDPEEPFKKVIWCYNGDFIFKWLKEEVPFTVKASNTVSFELLLPWKVVYPYHPWISPIGFDLYFVKAIGKTESNIHAVALDSQEKLGGFPLMYQVLDFEPPHLETGLQTYVTAERNCSQNDTVKATMVTVSAASYQEILQVTIADEIPSVIECPCTKGVTIKEFDLKTSNLDPGQYQVKWESQTSKSRGEIDLTVLPDFRVDTVYPELEQVKEEISTGSYNTLQFDFNQLIKRRNQLKPYETCPELIQDINSFLDIMRRAKKGEDVYQYKTGIVRRAFLSTLDNTLQPYTVRIPDDFDRTRKYPLLVFLHGSDRDDRELAKVTQFLSGRDFIQIAPFGRGTLNAFTKDNAQTDIKEALEDVSKNYNVDMNTIILTGFSMGGYGAYRTFYETPEKYKGLAVFSGVPNLAAFYFPGETHPNFLEDTYMKPFKGVPVFIFHGKKDLNAPFETTVELVKKLEAQGVNVTFCTEEEAGHGAPNPETIKKYYEWLQEVKEMK
jgi:predicted esterase